MSAKISLSNGGFFLVDEEDVRMAMCYRWNHYKGRVRRTLGSGKYKNSKTVYFAREILGVNDYRVVDHIDGNPLNNTRANLRICTIRENGFNRKLYANNTTGYRGVYWHKRIGQFQATIRVSGKAFHLGYYHKPEEAHKAYCLAADKYYGDFAGVKREGVNVTTETP